MGQDIYIYYHFLLSLIFIPSIIISNLQMRQQRHKEEAKKFCSSRELETSITGIPVKWTECKAAPLSLRLKCLWTTLPISAKKGKQRPEHERPVSPVGYCTTCGTFQRSCSGGGSKCRSEEWHYLETLTWELLAYKGSSRFGCGWGHSHLPKDPWEILTLK